MPHTTKMSKTDLEACEAVRKLFEAEAARTGMTQIVLGKMIKKSPKTVSAMMKGKMRVTLPVAKQLAKVFSVPITDILPWLAEVLGDAESFDIIADVQDLNEENLQVIRRMVRNLIDSQEEA